MGLADVIKSSQKSGPLPEKSDLAAYSEEGRKLAAYDLHLHGHSLNDISQHFGESLTKINSWISDARTQYSEFLSTHSGLDFLTDAVAEHEIVRAMALTELKELRESYTELASDGKRLKKKGFDHKANAKYLELAMMASRGKTDILMKSGAIPTQPERVHHTITGELKHEHKTQDESRDERSVEQIEADIQKRLKFSKLIDENSE